MFKLYSPRDRDSKTQEMGFIQRALRQTVDTGDEKLQLLFLSVYYL